MEATFTLNITFPPAERLLRYQISCDATRTATRPGMPGRIFLARAAGERGCDSSISQLERYCAIYQYVQRLTAFKIHQAEKTAQPRASARCFDGGLFEDACPWKRVTLVLTTAQLALRRRKAGISRTVSSIELRTGEERPYGSRPCGAAWCAYSEIGFSGRPSGWPAIGRSGGLSNCCGSGALRSIRSAMRRLSLRSLPASSVS